MGVLRPGGLELTRRALELAGLPAGASLLDVGCGDGTAAAFAKEEFKLTVTAVDRDEKAVAAACEKGLDARVMDAAALELPSRSFDGVMMECVFSALDRQEEALHEAYCVLRPGGALIMSDLYRRAPDMDRWQRDYRETMARYRRPRKDGECADGGDILPPSFSQDGAPVLEGVQGLLDELELEMVFFEDRTEDLKAFLGQAILNCGSAESWFRANGNWCPGASGGKDTGYFLLIARKKDA